MYEEINRFISHPDQVENFNSYFGTGAWQDVTSLLTPEARNRFLHDLYLNQLKMKAGARYVRSFQMRNASGLTDYYLFYATNNVVGLKRMKEAMWKVDETGEFTFSDATDPNQMVLFSKEPQYDILSKLILVRFGGREVTLGAVETFVIAETPFRETHYKQHVLKKLELAERPLLEVIAAPAGRRRGTYSDQAMKLRFLRVA